MDHHIHRKRRLANSAFFSQSSIKNTEPIIHAKIDLLCKNLMNAMAEQTIIDVGVSVLAFTMDTVCTIAFDISQDYLDNLDEAREWHDTIAAVAKMTTLLKQFPWLLGVAMKLPIAIFEILTPALGRLLRLHDVSHFRT